MERFTSMLNKLGLRGSSDDDHLDGKRSAQSTPRLRRHLVRDRSHDSQRSYGSLGSMENYRVQPRDPALAAELRTRALNRSWDCERVLGVGGVAAGVGAGVTVDPSWEQPERVLGMDRSWEVERARGLEMLYRSMEREKERQKEKDRGRGKHKKKRDRSKEHRDRSHSAEKNHVIEPLSTEVTKSQMLEHHVEELNKQLLRARQHSRRDKIAVAHLQRAVARQKSETAMRESLVKELERERMLRAEAEQQLRDMTVDSDNCKARLQALQDEFRKMEDMVRSMLGYKNKIERLRQEKANLTVSYETNLQKCRSHIGNLEQENMILLAEIKKLETQHSGSKLDGPDLPKQTPGSHGDDTEKYKVLLEQLKNLQAENSGLVLENEKQRHEYEKCLDEIAKEVVQALMTQKSLRAECLKLQTRVVDLESHNRQLKHMFSQRLQHFASDAGFQLPLPATRRHQQLLNNQAASAKNADSLASLPTQSGSSVTSGLRPSSRPGGEGGATAISQDSLDSLHSLCSGDYPESFQGTCEEALGMGKPEMSSPPPWLRDKMFGFGSPGSSDHAPSLTTLEQLPEAFQQETARPHASSEKASVGTNSGAQVNSSAKSGVNGMEAAGETHQSPAVNKVDSSLSRTQPPQPNASGSIPITYQTKIETEFPANNSSPKMRHLGVIYHHNNFPIAQRQATPVNLEQTLVKKVVSPTKSTPGASGSNVSKSVVTCRGCNSQERAKSSDITSSRIAERSECQNGGPQNQKVPYLRGSGSNPLRHLLAQVRGTTELEDSEEISPGKELLKLTDSFHQQYRINDSNGMPMIQNLLFDTDSDSDESSQLVSHNYSAGSTVSLNELLEKELDEMETPNDETFSADEMPIFSLEEVGFQITPEPEHLETINLVEDLCLGYSDETLTRKRTNLEANRIVENDQVGASCANKDGTLTRKVKNTDVQVESIERSADGINGECDILNNGSSRSQICSQTEDSVPDESPLDFEMQSEGGTTGENVSESSSQSQSPNTPIGGAAAAAEAAIDINTLLNNVRPMNGFLPPNRPIQRPNSLEIVPQASPQLKQKHFLSDSASSSSSSACSGFLAPKTENDTDSDGITPTNNLSQVRTATSMNGQSWTLPQSREQSREATPVRDQSRDLVSERDQSQAAPLSAWDCSNACNQLKVNNKKLEPTLNGLHDEEVKDKHGDHCVSHVQSVQSQLPKDQFLSKKPPCVKPKPAVKPKPQFCPPKSKCGQVVSPYSGAVGGKSGVCSNSNKQCKKSECSLSISCEAFTCPRSGKPCRPSQGSNQSCGHHRQNFDVLDGVLPGMKLCPVIVEVKASEVAETCARNTGIADAMSSSYSSSSPDSAMQQSFSSSSSSENALSDKPSCRDDGYSSNSTISASIGDLQHEIPERASRQTSVENHVGTISQGPYPDQKPHMHSCPVLDAVVHNWEKGADDSHLRRDSGCSNTSTSSADVSVSNRVRDIKAFFEGKMEGDSNSGRMVEHGDNQPHVGLNSQTHRDRHQSGPEVMPSSVHNKISPIRTHHTLSSGSSNDQSQCKLNSALPICGKLRDPSANNCETLAQEGVGILFVDHKLISPKSPDSCLRTQSYRSSDSCIFVPNSLQKIHNVGHVHMKSREVQQGTLHNSVPLYRTLSESSVENISIRKQNIPGFKDNLSGDWWKTHLSNGAKNKVTNERRAYSLPPGVPPISSKVQSHKLLVRRFEKNRSHERSPLATRVNGEGAESKSSIVPMRRPEAVGCEMPSSVEDVKHSPRGQSSQPSKFQEYQKKHNDMAWVLYSSDSEDETEAAPPCNFVDMWRNREGLAVTLPEWDPKANAENTKMKLTPSPLSVRKLDNKTSSEQWLLNFPKEEVDRYTSPISPPEEFKSLTPSESECSDLNWPSRHCHNLPFVPPEAERFCRDPTPPQAFPKNSSSSKYHIMEKQYSKINNESISLTDSNIGACVTLASPPPVFKCGTTATVVTSPPVEGLPEQEDDATMLHHTKELSTSNLQVLLEDNGSNASSDISPSSECFNSVLISNGGILDETISPTRTCLRSPSPPMQEVESDCLPPDVEQLQPEDSPSYLGRFDLPCPTEFVSQDEEFPSPSYGHVQNTTMEPVDIFLLESPNSPCEIEDDEYFYVDDQEQLNFTEFASAVHLEPPECASPVSPDRISPKSNCILSPTSPMAAESLSSPDSPVLDYLDQGYNDNEDFLSLSPTSCTFNPTSFLPSPEGCDDPPDCVSIHSSVTPSCKGMSNIRMGSGVLPYQGGLWTNAPKMEPPKYINPDIARILKQELVQPKPGLTRRLPDRGVLGNTSIISQLPSKCSVSMCPAKIEVNQPKPDIIQHCSDSCSSSDLESSTSSESGLATANHPELITEQGSELYVPDAETSSNEPKPDVTKSANEDLSPSPLEMPDLSHSLEEFEEEYANAISQVAAGRMNMENHSEYVDTEEDFEESSQGHDDELCDLYPDSSLVLDIETKFRRDFYSLCKVDTSSNTSSSAGSSRLHTPLGVSKNISLTCVESGNVSMLTKENDKSSDRQNRPLESKDTELDEQIASLARTVDELQRSLSSLENAGLSEEESTDSKSSEHSKCFQQKSTSATAISNNAQNIDTDLTSDGETDEKNQVLDAKARAEFLDNLVDSGTSEDSDFGEEVDSNIVSHLQQRRKRAGKRGAVRQSFIHRPAIDFTKFYIRYGDQEKQAMESFHFLEDQASPSSLSPSEEVQCYKTEECRLGSVLQPGESCGRTSGDGCNEKNHGRIEPSHTRSRPVRLSQPQNKTIITLKEESRGENPQYSNFSFDSHHSFNAESVSFSDSCCENFSGSESGADDMLFK